MSTWIVIVAAGLGSYLFRLSMILLTSRITMPPYLERASGLVAPAAFAALAAAGVAAACSGLGMTGAAAPLAAVAAAVIAVLRTGSPQAAILVGMPALWIDGLRSRVAHSVGAAINEARAAGAGHAPDAQPGAPGVRPRLGAGGRRRLSP
jgi:branched-subunit amino acid transport protein